ncbi:hypothetical protein [Aestuariirhabdus litorea]|uniref:Uncharacterized protein n=1 Tax=Aestuariirhabdus litorea TaxID=2528527 RepID=A0A3P3VIM4_9GAMM|nr:hypothetical protein [Aestuariirhabdus litorea]RRJ82591.1 hypothetical protein D0544_12050 [Aestuariirhabdus litorea]RWW92750.1 hypothetical protein DZC74_12025 [Endozoicomonadaceae bacterium GTF-13]
MSLYDESEKALSDINKILENLKESKTKIHESADGLTEALNAFVKLNGPLYEIVDKNLELDKIVKSSYDGTKEQMASLKGALQRDLERSVDLFTKSTESFNANLSSISSQIEEKSELIKESIDRSDAKLTKLIVAVLIILAVSLSLSGYMFFDMTSK